MWLWGAPVWACFCFKAALSTDICATFTKGPHPFDFLWPFVSAFESESEPSVLQNPLRVCPNWASSPVDTQPWSAFCNQNAIFFMSYPQGKTVHVHKHSLLSLKRWTPGALRLGSSIIFIRMTLRAPVMVWQSITVFGDMSLFTVWNTGGDSDPWQVFAALHREITHNQGQRPS